MIIDNNNKQDQMEDMGNRSVLILTYNEIADTNSNPRFDPREF